MDAVREMLLKMMLEVLGKLVTPEIVKGWKKAVVTYLEVLAADSSNEIDDAIVAIVKKALEVE